MPDHTVNFIRIILIATLIDAFVNPMFTANLASGKLAMYHGPLAILAYGFMFVTYFVVKLTHIPETAFLCLLAQIGFGFVLRIFIMDRQIGLKPIVYTKSVLAPVFAVVVVSVIAPLLVHHFMDVGWADFLVTSAIAVMSVAASVYWFGITKGEREFALNFVRNKIQFKKIHNN